MHDNIGKLKPTKNNDIKVAIWGAFKKDDKIIEVLKETTQKLNLKLSIIELTLPEFINALRNDNKSNKQFDITMISTGILIEDPIGDIKFMFLDKDGVNMPDLDGSICSYIKNNDKINIEIIEQKLFDQALIYPISHFSFGIWKKNKVDLSQYNSIIPPLDLSWIGQND